MHTPFDERLRSGALLVADGATGTNLHAAGLPAGSPPEAWVFDAPGQIVALHRAFIEAGSDLILTCTFGGTRLRMHGAPHADRTVALNRAAAQLARRAAEAAGRPVLVAGSMGPTGQLLEPFGPLTPEAVRAAYAEQAAALAEGGVDLLVLETFFDLEEAEAALDGVRRASDLPVVCSFSYDRRGRTMMGVSPARMAARFAGRGLAALGANCGASMDEMEAVVRELAAAGGGVPIWAKPNAGLPVGDPPRYAVGPEAMAAGVLRLVEAGAQVVGGCCGTTPAHVRAIAAAVRARVPVKPGA